jgi:hypothetical protein
MLKTFPQCLPARHDEDLTVSQWHWLHAHLLVDGGAMACVHCGAMTVGGRYCHDCGQVALDETQGIRCPECQVDGHGAYCIHCGTQLQSPTLEALDMGAFDWEAWEQRLTPFLHPLSTVEQQALGSGGSL